eukprot:gene20802-22842_t
MLKLGKTLQPHTAVIKVASFSMDTMSWSNILTSNKSLGEGGFRTAYKAACQTGHPVFDKKAWVVKKCLPSTLEIIKALNQTPKDHVKRVVQAQYLARYFAQMLEQQNFLMSRGIAVSDSNKTDLVKLAQAASTMGLPFNLEFHDDMLDLSERLPIKGMKLPDPFTIPEQELSSNIDNVPPFGIEDIFNFLIFKSSDYDQQKVASYKAFEEYGLFEDGYVLDLKVKEISGHFVFVGKVRPTMKPKTKEGERHYKLWFVIDGDRDETDKGYVRWKPTAGSVFFAYCYCPGGQDVACKHIAATLYSLHDCLHPMSGPTDKLCYWCRKFEKSADPSPISEVIVNKASTLMKVHGFKSRGRKNELKEIKRKLKEFGCTAAGFLLSDSESDENEEEICSHIEKGKPILYEKVNLYVKDGFKDPKEFLENFTISPHEVDEIESLTKSQSHSENWKIHRKGLITSTKLQDVVSRQTSIDKDPMKSGDSLARQILEGGNLDKYSKLPVQIEHGRVHENAARQEYTKLMVTTHENCYIESWSC